MVCTLAAATGFVPVSVAGPKLKLLNAVLPIFMVWPATAAVVTLAVINR